MNGNGGELVRVAIAGAHGQVATRLARLLVDRGDAVIGLIRNPEHAKDLRAAGVDPAICDLERATVDQIAAAVGGKTPLCSQRAQDQAAVLRENSRWTVMVRSGCSMQRPSTRRVT